MDTQEVSIRFDHAGAIVQDLETVASFFQNVLGLDRSEPFQVGGDRTGWLVGLEDVQATGTLISTPDGNGKLELFMVQQPARSGDPVDLPSHALGYRHVAYRVSDIEAVVKRARAAGHDLVGEVVNFGDQALLTYIRGPEGLIVELSQLLGE